MKAAFEFEAQPREQSGTGAARALRREGRIPAVLYSGGKTPVQLSLPEKELMLAYNKGAFYSRIVSLKMGKETFFALPKEVQLHPVTDKPEHADFLKVDANSRITVKVPVRFKNQEKCLGIKRGGVLNVVRHDLELFCRPDSIPTVIEIDIAASNIGDSIHINDIALPDNVTPTIKRNFTVATIAGRSAKDDTAAETAAAAPAADAAKAAPAKADAKDKK